MVSAFLALALATSRFLSVTTATANHDSEQELIDSYLQFLDSNGLSHHRRRTNILDDESRMLFNPTLTPSMFDDNEEVQNDPGFFTMPNIIIIGIAAVVLLLVCVVGILYCTGCFDPPKKKNMNQIPNSNGPKYAYPASPYDIAMMEEGCYPAPRLGGQSYHRTAISPTDACEPSLDEKLYYQKRGVLYAENDALARALTRSGLLSSRSLSTGGDFYNGYPMPRSRQGSRRDLYNDEEEEKHSYSSEEEGSPKERRSHRHSRQKQYSDHYHSYDDAASDNDDDSSSSSSLSEVIDDTTSYLSGRPSRFVKEEEHQRPSIKKQSKSERHLLAVAERPSLKKKYQSERYVLQDDYSDENLKTSSKKLSKKASSKRSLKDDISRSSSSSSTISSGKRLKRKTSKRHLTKDVIETDTEEDGGGQSTTKPKKKKKTKKATSKEKASLKQQVSSEDESDRPKLKRKTKPSKLVEESKSRPSRDITKSDHKAYSKAKGKGEGKKSSRRNSLT